MKHILKTDSLTFYMIRFDLKGWHLVFNDKDFKVKDDLVFKEWVDGEFTGDQLIKTVVCIHSDEVRYGLKEGYVILSLV